MQRFILLLIFAHAFTIKALSQDPRYNVIVIVADDLGINDLGCYGNKYIETPNLDKFAARSIRFSNAYAASPVCSPSRASILTGQYPARIGLTNFIDGRLSDPSSTVQPAPFLNYLPAAYKIMPEFFRMNGYKTALIGKWHLGENTQPEKSFPGNNGFDVVKHFDYGLVPNGKSYSWVRPGIADTFLMPDITRVITEDVEAYLSSAHEKPFFLMVTHYTPHLPLQADKLMVKKYKDKANTTGKPVNPKYAAMVEDMDTQVGIILNALVKNKLEEKTIVIFLSDNGGVVVDEAGEEQPTNSGPFREGKGTLYEGGIRIPLIVYHPRQKKPHLNSSFVNTVDLLPTLISWNKLKIPFHTIDGENFGNLIDGKVFKRNRPMFWHYPHFSNQGGRPSAAIRSGNYKLVLSLENDSFKLYDLGTDPGEVNDIAGANKARASQLLKELIQWQKSVQATMPVKKSL